jgi:hypothetical protein
MSVIRHHSAVVLLGALQASFRKAGTIIGAVAIRDLATGQEKVLFQSAAGVKIDDAALSPDGQHAA